MFDHISRLGDDLRKRALTNSDDVVRRALAASDDLARRASRHDLVREARSQGESLVDRARSQGGEWIDRLQPVASDLMRRVRPHTATPAQESRSFLSSPGVALAGAAALGVAAGIALNAGRKAAVQGAEALAGDWFEILKAEHKAVDKLFEQLLRTTDRQTIRRTFLLGRIAHALSKHALQEEMVIYPALKESSADGQAMHLYEEHAQIKIFIHELQEIPKDSALWLERVRAFHSLIQEHVREEEDDIFPGYHGRMSPQQNRHLTIGLHKEGLKLA